jgi:hypothetical protein
VCLCAPGLPNSKDAMPMRMIGTESKEGEYEVVSKVSRALKLGMEHQEQFRKERMQEVGESSYQPTNLSIAKEEPCKNFSSSCRVEGDG